MAKQIEGNQREETQREGKMNGRKRNEKENHMK